MWTKILWATDFSECAHHAGRRALDIAHWSNARIDVVTIIPPDTGDLPPMLLSFLGEERMRAAERGLEIEVSEAVREHLQSEAGFLFAAGREPGLHVRLGEPADQIVALARELGSDLLVMGATCRRGVTDVVFGTTLDIVTRQAPCPVLVVR